MTFIQIQQRMKEHFPKIKFNEFSAKYFFFTKWAFQPFERCHCSFEESINYSTFLQKKLFAANFVRY